MTTSNPNGYGEGLSEDEYLEAVQQEAEGSTETYTVTWSNGDRDEEFDSFEDAVSSIEDRYPDLEYGHDGDLSEGGDRTLVWANEEDSVNDDGAKAIASIRKA